MFRGAGRSMMQAIGCRILRLHALLRSLRTSLLARLRTGDRRQPGPPAILEAAHPADGDHGACVCAAPRLAVPCARTVPCMCVLMHSTLSHASPCIAAQINAHAMPMPSCLSTPPACPPTGACACAHSHARMHIHDQVALDASLIAGIFYFWFVCFGRRPPQPSPLDASVPRSAHPDHQASGSANLCCNAGTDVDLYSPRFWLRYAALQFWCVRVCVGERAGRLCCGHVCARVCAPAGSRPPARRPNGHN